MDLQIIKKDGTKINLIDHNCIAKDILVNSIEMDAQKEVQEGRSGFIDYGADYRSRTIKVPLIFQAAGQNSYPAIRDDLNDILTDTESYYIRELRRIKKPQYKFTDTGEIMQYEDDRGNVYVNGRQILVRLVSELEWKQSIDGKFGSTTAEFETTELPFFETTYKSTLLHNSQMTKDLEAFGMYDGINPSQCNYIFNTNKFTVYNHGNVTLNPLEMDFQIVIRNLTTSGNFKIKNLTTNETYIYKAAVDNKEMQHVTGLTLISGLNQQANANTEYITLAKGANDFEITGGTFKDVIINTKFYFK